MNEILRRALLAAHLDEVDVAARLEVDPKTVRRWLEGRLPQTRHRWALTNLLNLNETDLWPELRAAPSRPGELLAVYPHRSSVPRETWRNLFASAEYEISILSYSSLFIAEDAYIMRIFAEKARSGVRVHIALGDPDNPCVPEPAGQGEIGDVVAARIRNALALYQSLRNIDGIEIRIHRAVLYNAIYRADEQLFVNQYTYGIPADRSPVYQLRGMSGLTSNYFNSLANLWKRAKDMT